MLAILVAILLALMPASPQGVNNGTIEVTVHDRDTRQGVPSVRVTVTLDRTQPTQPPNFELSSFTDNKGVAEFENLVYGVYNIRISRDGYGSTETADRVSVFVRDDARAQNVQLYLSRALTLSGRVLGPDGTLQPNLRVVALALGYKDGLRRLNRVAPILPPAARRSNGSVEADTNDQGEYRLAGLPVGEYYLRVQSAQALGHNASIFYYPGVLRTSDAIPVALRNQDAVGIDIRIPRTPVFNVSGTLAGLLPGPARPNNGFYLASAAPGDFDEPSALYVPNMPTGIPGESSFEIRGVIPGIYNLYAETRADRARRVSRTLVRVADRDVRDLSIVFRPATEVRGRILVEGDAAAIRWNAVGIGVSPKEVLPLLLGGTGLETVRPGINGQTPNEFTLIGLIDGIRYMPVVYGLPPDAYIADIRQGGFSVLTNGGAIRSNATDGPVEVVIGLKGGVVQGVVRNPSGQGVAQAGVTLVPGLPRRGTIQLYKEVQTDAAGQFTFRGVTPGEYKVFAWSSVPRGQAYVNEEFLATYEFRGAYVRVTADSSATVEATVIQLP